MGKYETLTRHVLSVFGLQDWSDKGVETYPSNFIPAETNGRYIALNVIPSGKALNLVSASGVLIVDIYTLAGKGPQDAMLIADLLDEYLRGRSIQTEESSVTQFVGASSWAPVGIAKDDPRSHLSTFTIKFNYFGASQ